MLSIFSHVTENVYAFFDVSSCSYEVYPEELFHVLFPWHLYGTKFQLEEARLDQDCQYAHSPLLPRACVPVIWSRRITFGHLWGKTRKLIFDDWRMPNVVAPSTYWDSSGAVSVESWQQGVAEQRKCPTSL